MSQTSEERPGQSATAVERAEELISGVEKRIGSFTTFVGQRVQQTTTRIRKREKQSGTAQEEKSNPQAAEPGHSAMEKADQMVGDMGQYMSLIATIASLQTRKTTARVRENAEDMWAEIQQIRNGRGAQHH